MLMASGILLLLLSWIFVKLNISLNWKIQSLLIVFPWIIFGAYSLWLHREIKQKIIIPDTYKGLVIINYRPNYKPSKKEDGYWIIETNNNGIGLTSVLRNDMTLEGIKLYSKTKNNTLHEIPVSHFNTFEKQDTLKIQAFLAEDLGDRLSFIICNNKDVGNYFSPGANLRLNHFCQEKFLSIIDSLNKIQ